MGSARSGQHVGRLRLSEDADQSGASRIARGRAGRGRREGEHLGKNFGRVLQITHSAVVLNELHQDEVGVWTERKTSLQLVTDAT